MDFAGIKTSKRRVARCLKTWVTAAVRLSGILHFIWMPYSLIFLAIGLTCALGAEVGDVVIDTSRDHLLLSAKIRDVGCAEIHAVPEADASATIIFSIALYEVKTLWFNKKMAYHTATNTIMRHPEKNEFRLLRSWDSAPPLKFNALDQARRMMVEISKLRVMPLAGLEKGRTYQLRVRAVCQDKNAFVFSAAECFKTDWHTVDFTF